ncbi:MAG TPA: hypothetical protein VG778_10565 [Blastocatellia bacterium]|jgi:hypothetical protein|nr:hypothetical protein [Blastocatellia bacterium]
MRTILALVVVSFLGIPPVCPFQAEAAPQAQTGSVQGTGRRQLLAVRGEVIRIKAQAGATLLITVRPAKEFAEVTVLARENDLVGSAAGGSGGDLFGVLVGEARDDETITAAELSEGDRISVIYDPQFQNRVVEVYIH